MSLFFLKYSYKKIYWSLLAVGLDLITLPCRLFIKVQDIKRMKLPSDCKILISATGGIGDAILLEPFIRHFRSFFPECSVDVIASSLAKNVFNIIPGINQIIDFPDQGSYFYRWVLFFRYAKIEKKYDLGFDTKGDPLSVLYFLRQGITKRIGFKNGGGRNLLNYSIDSSVLVPKYQQNLIFFGEQYLSGEPLLKKNADIVDLIKPTLTIHLGAGREDKIWPLNLWEEVIISLSENFNIIMIGSEADGECDRNFSQFTKSLYLKKTGEPFIRSVEIISGSHLFIGHDTGMTHISAALGIKTICLFSLVNEKIIWAPMADAILEFGGKDNIYLSVERVLQTVNHL